MNLFEMKQAQKAALDKAEALLGANDHVMTVAEQKDYEAAMDKFTDLGATIRARQEQNTIRTVWPKGTPGLEAPRGATGAVDAFAAVPRRVLGEDYRTAFSEYVSSNGHKISAALYEGSNPAGGFIVPVVVEGQVVPLAPTDMGVRSIASVIPTSADLKLPRATTISTAEILCPLLDTYSENAVR